MFAFMIRLDFFPSLMQDFAAGVARAQANAAKSD